MTAAASSPPAGVSALVPLKSLAHTNG
jgi:hypothetical protein